jgi:hypothetical protein
MRLFPFLIRQEEYSAVVYSETVMDSISRHQDFKRQLTKTRWTSQYVHYTLIKQHTFLIPFPSISFPRAFFSFIIYSSTLKIYAYILSKVELNLLSFLDEEIKLCKPSKETRTSDRIHRASSPTS